jgi:hypothetical protein
MWLLWCRGLQQEGPLVLCSQARSGHGVGCRRVSADMWYLGCGQGVLQPIGVWGSGLVEATGGVLGHVCLYGPGCEVVWECELATRRLASGRAVAGVWCGVYGDQVC